MSICHLLSELTLLENYYVLASTMCSHPRKTCFSVPPTALQGPFRFRLRPEHIQHEITRKIIRRIVQQPPEVRTMAELLSMINCCLKSELLHLVFQRLGRDPKGRVKVNDINGIGERLAVPFVSTDILELVRADLGEAADLVQLRSPIDVGVSPEDILGTTRIREAVLVWII